MLTATTKKVLSETRKTFKIRESGRSTDYIAPSFGFGCLLNCSYCYMKRHRPDKSVKIATNVDEILMSIDKHVNKLPWPKQPNQTDSVYYTYDIACNEDFALHAKHHEWERIFEFFKHHPKAKASLATKIIPLDFMHYNPQGKVRIRFSLMPQRISTTVEPNTPAIIDRIKAIDAFIEAGYDVHVNYSPVIVYREWQEDYKELFNMMKDYVDDAHKESVLAEVIFLTHNKNKHYYNLEHKLPGEHLLWVPNIQENKVSQYGGENIRYNRHYKAQWMHEFRQMHQKIVPWNRIRYIF